MFRESFFFWFFYSVHVDSRRKPAKQIIILKRIIIFDTHRVFFLFLDIIIRNEGRVKLKFWRCDCIFYFFYLFSSFSLLCSCSLFDILLSFPGFWKTYSLIAMTKNAKRNVVIRSRSERPRRSTHSWLLICIVTTSKFKSLLCANF